MSDTCIIVGAGEMEHSGIEVQSGDYVIAADGGLVYLERLGISADMVLGDFDSLGYIPQHDNLSLHPVEKDDTDMMLAVREGMKLGYRKFRIYGGLGGRLDHTLANLQTLIFLAKQGAEAELVGSGCTVTAVHNGSVCFDASCSGVISILCMDGRAKGVTIKGLKYTLDDGELNSERPLGVSNAFVGTDSRIEVKDGTLIILRT